MNPREERIVAYLNAHPKFLDDYITGQNVTNEMFHHWGTRRNMKMRKDVLRQFSGQWLADDLSECQNLLISSGNNSALLLYELGHACAQMVRTALFDVCVYKDHTAYLISRTENRDVQLKRIARPQRMPVYTKKLQGYSGILLGCFYNNKELTFPTKR